MDKLRVGIIGTGRISDLHALEYLANEKAEILAENIESQPVMAESPFACTAKSMIDVVPPHAAARVPVSMSSLFCERIESEHLAAMRSIHT